MTFSVSGLRAAAASIFLAGTAACVTPRAAMKPGYDFSKIHSVAVVEQGREDRQAITDEVVRQLIGMGYDMTVVPSNAVPAKADALLQVNVAQYLPDKKYMVQLNQDQNQNRGGHRHRRDVIVMNPPTEVPGTVYPAMGVPGVDGEQILESNATVAISFRLLDGGTKAVVWSSSGRYEGLDLASAVEGAVDTGLKEFPSKTKK